MPNSSFTQGAPLPDITQTTTKATEAPQYYTDYLGGLAQAGQTALAKTPEQLIAPMTALQEQGYAAIPGAATAYQPGLATATQTAGEAAGLTGADINQFMNPYTTNVVNEMERLAQQNIQRNVLPGLKAGFVGSGDLGSRRYAGALGQSMGDIQRNLTGQQYTALSAGYSDAVKAALQEQQNQLAAAKTQADLAAQEQTLGLTGAGAMTKAGAEQQAYQQSLREAPLQTASNVAKLMAGQQVPLSTTETFKGPKAGLYQTSPLANILSVGSVLAAAKEGTALKDIIGGISTGLKNLYNNATGSGIKEIQNTATPGAEGYGWRYFSDGTSISPSGEYYQGGNLIWSPSFSGGDVGNITTDGPTVDPDTFGTDGEAP